jgi:hypothetical protein
LSAESGGNGNAANYNSNGKWCGWWGVDGRYERARGLWSAGSYDVGAWQINSSNWASCSGGKAPCDMDTNLDCAIKVWTWGDKSFKLWSTCSQCGAC